MKKSKIKDKIRGIVFRGYSQSELQPYLFFLNKKEEQNILEKIEDNIYKNIDLNIKESINMLIVLGKNE